MLQNVALTAMSLGLGAWVLGGLFDDELGALLTLDVERELALDAAAVGAPAEGDPTQPRMIE